MRGCYPMVAALCLMACLCSPVAAQEKWTDYRAPDQAFAVQFPAIPKVTSKAVEGKAPLTHHEYQVALGDTVYSVSVMQFTGGKGPDHPDTAYLGGLIASYAKGTKTTLRSQNPVTLVGYPALEAVTEDVATNHYHLLDVFAAGARVYLIVSEGPRGHEAGADAKRFRNSFKLLGP